MAYTIAFFGTKPYDESSFNDKNKEFGFEIRYYKGHLNKNNVLLTQGVDAVCIFVNDVADAEVIRIMAENGVKLLALRCAGFNNVDLQCGCYCRNHRSTCSCLLSLCRCRIHRSSDVIIEPENPPCILAHERRKFLPSWFDGIRYAWKNSRNHRYGENSKNPDSYPKRFRNECAGIRSLSGL